MVQRRVSPGSAPGRDGHDCGVSVAAVQSVRRGLDRLTRRRDTTRLARLGLVARTGFYLLLAYLTVSVAAQHGGGRQVNAHGALATIAGNPAGMAVLAATVMGFVLLGLMRLGASLRDRRAPARRRAAAGLQGLFYLAAGYVPLSFLLGRQRAGSEQQQHREAAQVIGLPAGREIVIAVGLVVLGGCAWQIRTALSQDFADGMDLDDAPAWIRRAAVVSGTVGIAARALVFGPIGVFLVIAGVQADPRHADGLDAELASLAREPYGPWLLGIVAAGLLVFATYSGFEAGYRKIDSSR